MLRYVSDELIPTKAHFRRLGGASAVVRVLVKTLHGRVNSTTTTTIKKKKNVYGLEKR